MITAAIVFAIAAMGGAAMAALRLGGRDRPPTWLALVHGAVAAAGLALLIIRVTGAEVPRLGSVALGGFVVAALGGFVMFFLYHLKGRALPLPLMFIHATVAVLSFVCLLILLFTG